MTVDYRRFLGAGGEPVVLPYFGGARVDARDRLLRLAGELAPGWWRFRIDGRRAVPIEPAAPAELGDLPAVRGHWAEGWVFAAGGRADRIALPPAEEPAALARVTARRWPSGDLLLDAIDFEDDAEVEARRALDDGRPLAGVRGVAPSLRAAFGFAVAAAAGRARGIPVSPREAASRVHAIADGGRDAADRLLDDLVEARRRGRLQAQIAAARPRPRAGDPVARAEAALDAAGARMLGHRHTGDATLEVRFEVDGERFVTVVDAGTLQVLDAGICLAGADRELTLDSLPSVIREAIETEQLNITRWA